MHRGNHSVKARASQDSPSVLVRAGDVGIEPVERLVNDSVGSREPVQWSRFLRVSEEKCFAQPDMDLQDAVRLSSVLRQLSDIQDAVASKELSSEQSVAFSQSVRECSVHCPEFSVHEQDAVSSADCVQSDYEGGTVIVDELVSCSVVAASSKDDVSSTTDVYACSDEVASTGRSGQIVDDVTATVVHDSVAAAGSQVDVSRSADVCTCSDEVLITGRSRCLSGCSKEGIVHDFVVAAGHQDDVGSSTKTFACSVEVLSSQRDQRVFDGDVQDVVHGDVSVRRSRTDVGAHDAVSVAEVQLSRQRSLTDSQNKVLFTSVDDRVPINRRQSVRSRSCSAVLNSEHSHRSCLADSWNKAVFTPESRLVADNRCRLGCSRSSRFEAETENDKCLQITPEPKLAANSPVRDQLSETVVGVGYSDKSVQVVQSELCQAVSQTEATVTSEFSVPQQLASVEQFSQVARQRKEMPVHRLLRF